MPCSLYGFMPTTRRLSGIAVAADLKSIYRSISRRRDKATGSNWRRRA